MIAHEMNFVAHTVAYFYLNLPNSEKFSVTTDQLNQLAQSAVRFHTELVSSFIPRHVRLPDLLDGCICCQPLASVMYTKYCETQTIHISQEEGEAIMMQVYKDSLLNR